MNDRMATMEAIYWWQAAAVPAWDAPAPRPGDPCPQCGQAALAYDPQFVLACPACGHVASSGAFT